MIAKESASGAEQSAAAAEELNRQAEGMQNMVNIFKVKSNGDDAKKKTKAKKEEVVAD